MKPNSKNYNPIHRHTGGLEMSVNSRLGHFRIHRHTGGLENNINDFNNATIIHRHTGGLEK